MTNIIVILFFIIIILVFILNKNIDFFYINQYNPPIQNIHCISQSQKKVNSEPSFNSSQINLEKKLMLENLKKKNKSTDKFLSTIHF